MRQIFKFIFILSVTTLIGYSCNTTTETKSRIHYPNGDLLVSAKYLKSCLNKPNLVVLDVRSKGYETGHIPGAVKISLGDFIDSQKTLKSIIKDLSLVSEVRP